jgi:hypothetical protein
MQDNPTNEETPPKGNVTENKKTKRKRPGKTTPNAGKEKEQN